jgi:hypothetical protein
MECQRGPGGARRVRLTDQALVAVVLARETAAAQRREATALDVLIGLGAEPDGWAGQLLRQRSAALVVLADRAASPPPALAPLDEVVAAAADRALPRPPGTRDLLAAVLTVGGDDVDDLLAACGYAGGDLWPATADDPGRGGAAPAEELWLGAEETVTLVGPGLPVLTPAAARAVGRVRAIAGGALALLEQLVGEHAGSGDGTVGEATVLGALAARAHLERAEPAAAASTPHDAGLDPVLAVAADLAAGRAATTADLLHALLLAGGTGPLQALRHDPQTHDPGGRPG